MAKSSIRRRSDPDRRVACAGVMTVAILCGGKGTRMREAGEFVPKPLVEVGGKPILWHVMCLYASQGFTRFLLLLGHGGERIEAFAAELSEEWEVTCLDTGGETPTGGGALPPPRFVDPN